MKNIIISIMILISGVITAQKCKIDLHSLAQPDINYCTQQALFK